MPLHKVFGCYLSVVYFEHKSPPRLPCTQHVKGLKSKGQIVAITVIFLAKYDHLSCKYLVKYEDGLLVFKIYEKCFSSHTIRIVGENHNQALHERYLTRMDF